MWFGSSSAQLSQERVRNFVSRLNTVAETHSLRRLLATDRDPRARKRILVIILSQPGYLTAVQVACRVKLARSTVFAYRRLFAEHGIEGLLARTRPGRPATRVTPALEKVIIQGLRLLSWFNIPVLQKWIRHHDRMYPHWTVRRWAIAYVKRLKIRFPKDWRTERTNSYHEWRRSIDPLDNSYTRWRRIRALRESTEPSLNLVVGNSAGLLPWHDLAA